MAYVGGVGVPLRMLQHTLGAQRVKSLTLAPRMEQKFRKLLLQRRKSVMGELEYGPPRENDARLPPVLKGAPEALDQMVQHCCLLGVASKDEPETWVSPHLCCAVCFSENHPEDAPISIPSLCSPPHLCRWVRVFL